MTYAFRHPSAKTRPHQFKVSAPAPAPSRRVVVTHLAELMKKVTTAVDSPVPLVDSGESTLPARRGWAGKAQDLALGIVGGVTIGVTAVIVADVDLRVFPPAETLPQVEVIQPAS